MSLRLIGLDVHRDFAQVAELEQGRVRQIGRIATTAEGLHEFAKTLGPDDQVALEATCNTYAIARLLQQHAGRVVVSNPVKTRAIAEAKIKTDKVDAEVLVRLLAGDWLPTVWLPDDQTQTFRQQVAHRARLVQQKTRLKNRVHAILHRNLIPGCPRSDLFGKAGRHWLTTYAMPGLPNHEQATLEATMREFDVVQAEVARADRVLASWALEHPDIRRLLTIPGVDAAVACALVAAIGDIRRFPSAPKLVGYLGLDPRVRQSGNRPASHGRITKQGRAHARGAVVEAAWAAIKAPGPLRACYQRLRARRGPQIAAVAIARKLTVLAWHLLTRGEDYAYARPAFVVKKLRTLELKAGRPAQRGRRGATYGYYQEKVRRAEMEAALRAEHAYERLTAEWQTRRPPKDAGAPNGKRL
jgi:transposase